MSRTKRCRKFLGEYIEFMSDSDPTGLRPRMAKVVKKQVYEDLYCPQVREEDSEKDPLSYRHFCSIWFEDYSHVLLSDKKRFSQCPTCWTHTTAWLNSNDPRERSELLLAKNGHLAEVRDGRFKAACLHELALQFPTEFCFVMLDAMDSNKCIFPITAQREIKGVDDLDGYRVKITNVLTDVKNFFFLQDESTPSGTDAVISMLCEVLDFIRLSRGGKFPRKLIFVADSATENKSRTLASFFAFLTRYAVFSSASWLFLVVGHTHWLNDQTFSRLARYFSSHDTRVLTPQDLTDYLETSVAIDSLGGVRDSLVSWIRRVPDFTSFFEPFLLNSVKERLRSWGVSSWNFMTVRNPFNDDLEVQICQSMHMLNREEIIQSYWREGSRGLFPFRIMQRYFGGHRFQSLSSEACARDLTFLWNQPTYTVVWPFWPFTLSTFRRLVPFHHNKPLNLKLLRAHLARKGLDTDPVWIDHLEELEELTRNECPQCHQFDVEMAEVKPPSRLKRYQGTVDTFEQRLSAFQKLKQAKQKHIRRDATHIPPGGGFDLLSKVFNEWGGRDWWEPEEDDKVAALGVGSDFLSALDDGDSPLGERMSKRCRLFTSPNVRQRLAERTATGTELEEMREMKWNDECTRGEFVRDLRAWDLEDTSTQFHQLTVEEIVELWWKFVREMDGEIPGSAFVSPFEESPQDPYRDLSSLFSLPPRPFLERFLHRSRFIKFTVEGVSVGQSHEVKDSESDSSETSATESDSSDADTNGHVGQAASSPRRWCDLPHYEERIRPFLDDLISCRLTFENKVLWVTRGLLVLRPGQRNDREAQKSWNISSVSRVHRQWWANAGTSKCWWGVDAVKPCKPPPRASARINHLSLFFFAGADDDFVYGHWLENESSVRKGCVDFVLKHAFTGQKKRLRENTAWTRRVSATITCHFIETFRPVRIALAEWNEYYLLCPPFDMIPPIYQRSVKRPVFTPAIPSTLMMRREFGWQFTHQVGRA